MEYIIIPATLLEGKETELNDLSLSPRKSVDEKEVILHLEHYTQLFPPKETKSIGNEPDAPIDYGFPVYNAPSVEFDKIMDSDNWNPKESI